MTIVRLFLLRIEKHQRTRFLFFEEIDRKSEKENLNVGGHNQKKKISTLEGTRSNLHSVRSIVIPGVIARKVSSCIHQPESCDCEWKKHSLRSSTKSKKPAEEQMTRSRSSSKKQVRKSAKKIRKAKSEKKKSRIRKSKSKKNHYRSKSKWSD